MKLSAGTRYSSWSVFMTRKVGGNYISLTKLRVAYDDSLFKAVIFLQRGFKERSTTIFNIDGFLFLQFELLVLFKYVFARHVFDRVTELFKTFFPRIC